MARNCIKGTASTCWTLFNRGPFCAFFSLLLLLLLPPRFCSNWNVTLTHRGPFTEGRRTREAGGTLAPFQELRPFLSSSVSLSCSFIPRDRLLFFRLFIGSDRRWNLAKMETNRRSLWLWQRSREQRLGKSFASETMSGITIYLQRDWCWIDYYANRLYKRNIPFRSLNVWPNWLNHRNMANLNISYRQRANRVWSLFVVEENIQKP